MGTHFFPSFLGVVITYNYHLLEVKKTFQIFHGLLGSKGSNQNLLKKHLRLRGASRARRATEFFRMCWNIWNVRHLLVSVSLHILHRGLEDMSPSPQNKQFAPTRPKPKGKLIFQPQCFRCELLVSGRVGFKSLYKGVCQCLPFYQVNVLLTDVTVGFVFKIPLGAWCRRSRS